MFVLGNDVHAQLVALDLEADTVLVVEGITGTLVEEEAWVGVVEDVEDLAGTIDAICGAVAGFEIASFGPSRILEVGDTLTAPSFVATYTMAPTSASLTDDDGSPAKDVSATPTSFASDGAFTKTSNNAVVTFTLTAARDAVIDIATVAARWQARTYWGIGGAALLTEAQIEALAGDQLDSDFATTFAVDAPGPSDFVWYCFPQSFDPTDAAIFQVGQFPGGFVKVGVVTVTNSNGVAQSYSCWRSDFPALGSIAVQVY